MKLWLIAKSNMRRKKGNVAILFVLIMLATMLLYTSINVLKNINSFIDDKNESQNGAHVSLVLSDDYQEEIEDMIKSASGYREMETELVGTGTGNNSIKNVTKDLKKESISFLFGDIEQERTISNLTICDKGDTLKGNSIVLPMYAKVANGYETGDEVTITFGNQVENFEVYGFTEDPLFATPSNITVYKAMVTQDKLEEMRQDIPTFKNLRMYTIRLDDMEHSADYENAVTKQMNERIKDPAFMSVFVVNYTTMRMGVSIFIDILMAVIAVFSILIILISLIVIRYSINSSLEENLPNIGISEAIGYTTGQLMGATILEYILTTAGGMAAGFAIAGGVSGYFAGLVSASVGLVWRPSVDVLAACYAIVVVVVLILGILLVATRKYKRITTLDALRGGISTHNFKRNHLPLSKWNFGTNTTLGMKSLLQNKKQNVSVAVIVALLAYTCVISLSWYYNFVEDDQALINLVGIEKPDIQIMYLDDNESPDKTSVYREAERLETQENIDKVNVIGNMLITLSNQEKELSVDADIYEDFDKVDLDTLVEGRYPKHDNEINMTNLLADRFDLSLGDSITLQKNNRSESYVVVGITQQISRMGIQITMGENAMRRLDDTYQPSGIYVYVNGSEKTASDTVKELTNYYEDDSRYTIIDFGETYATVLKSFTNALTGLCIAFLTITAGVVILIVLLTVRMKLVRDRKYMGVYKALGYTTPQIIWQTIMSFVPVVAIGAVIGAVLGCLTANRVFALMMSICGIENCNLFISAGWVFGCTFGIIALAFTVAVLGALRVRKIEPYKMITEG